MMRRKIHGLLGLRDRPPQLHAPVSDAFRALLARTKSKPSIPLSGREVIAKSAPTISAKPVGVGARFQPWIVKDERSGLWTRTGETDGVSLSPPTKRSALLLNLKVRC